jgi:hypothetical protein
MKSKKVWITFQTEPLENILELQLKGEWNAWELTAMKQKKDGSFYVRKKIAPGSWQFGFLTSNEEWITSELYDKTGSPFNSFNNTITVAVK